MKKRDTVHENIKAWLDRKLISQKRLGEEIGKSKSSISGYCDGTKKVPIDVLTNIAIVLGCELEDLIPNDCDLTIEDVQDSDEVPIKWICTATNKTRRFWTNAIINRNISPNITSAVGVKYPHGIAEVYISKEAATQLTGLSYEEICQRNGVAI